MAEELALEPHLKTFLVGTGLMRNLGDDSAIPEAQLRAIYGSAFT